MKDTDGLGLTTLGAESEAGYPIKKGGFFLVMWKKSRTFVV
jgi:hypothetical protein